jgi:hypothetical protein
MAFRDLADSRGAVLAERLGEPGCTYAHAGGGTVSDLDVVYDEDAELVDSNGQLVERTRAASIRKSELLQAPVMGDALTVLGTTYRVQRVLGDDGVFVQVALA